MGDDSGYAKWLAFQIDHNSKYHQHKENMAWVATAFYVPGIISLSYYVLGRWQCCLVLQVIFTLIISLIAYLLFCFIKMQFDMRWYAADVVRILMQRLIKFHKDKETLATEYWVTVEEDKDTLPQVIQEEVKKSGEGKRKCEKACEAFFKRLHLFWRSEMYRDENEVDDRWKTELPSYVIFSLATLAAVCLVWNLLPR